MTKHVLRKVNAINVYYQEDGDVSVDVHFVEDLLSKRAGFYFFSEAASQCPEFNKNYHMWTLDYFNVKIAVKEGIHLEKSPALAILDFLVENFEGLPAYISASRFDRQYLAHRDNHFIGFPMTERQAFNKPLAELLGCAEQETHEINKWINMLASEPVTVTASGFRTIRAGEWMVACPGKQVLEALENSLCTLAQKAGLEKHLSFSRRPFCNALFVCTTPELNLHNLLANNELDRIAAPSDSASGSYALMQDLMGLPAPSSSVPSAECVPMPDMARPELEDSDLDSIDEEIIFTP